MKVKMKAKKGNTLKLVLEDSNPSFVNTLRRAIMTEVPTLAIEDVRIIENTSPIYDEIIAHRLGLIPIPTDLGLYNIRHECKCKGKGCPSCTVGFALEKEGPAMVYSQDLKSDGAKIKLPRGIPLLKLGKNQNIVLEAVAILGRGKEHAKWQPAIASYKYYPMIKIGPECAKCKKCAEICPTHVYSIKRGKLKVVDLEGCILCNACVEACEAGDLKVSGRDDKFIFKIEGTGAIDPKKVFNTACDIISGKAKELEALL
ncbi:MAG: DNA-directed RNA polymerase subunit D [Candidatus Hydrothermarchaeaceae archaeon]